MLFSFKLKMLCKRKEYDKRVIKEESLMGKTNFVKEKRHSMSNKFKVLTSFRLLYHHLTLYNRISALVRRLKQYSDMAIYKHI